MYDADKDPAVAAILQEVDKLVGEDHLPLELRIQRVATIRDRIAGRVREMKVELAK